MCHPSCLEFGHTSIHRADVFDKMVLEVGSQDVNGSMRSMVEKLSPARYVGIDLQEGPGVDEVCTAEDMVERFGPDTVDLLINTEMLEHVHDWRCVVSNLKRVLKPGGVLILTTRSRGYPIHGFPSDYWRFEIADFEKMFGDMIIDELESDPSGGPGVFLRARKPESFTEANLENYALFSVISQSRTSDLYFDKGLMLRFKCRLWLATRWQHSVIGIIGFAKLIRPLVPASMRKAVRRWLVRQHEKHLEQLKKDNMQAGKRS